MNYTPDWNSLDQRPVPEWFDKAKFGIFIHWGLYSVPAWAPKRRDVDSTGEAYAEWYGAFMDRQNSPVQAFHHQKYGKSFQYQDFASYFKAELFCPEKWDCTILCWNGTVRYF